MDSFNTFQKLAEAKRSGLYHTNGTHEQAEKLIDDAKNMPPGDVVFVPTPKVETPPLTKILKTNDKPSQKASGRVPWLTVVFGVLILAAVLYTVWVVKQQDPAKTFEKYKIEAQQWIKDQLSSNETAREIIHELAWIKAQLSDNEPVREVIKSVPVKSNFQVKTEHKYKMAQMLAFNELQKYIADRFFDTTPPPGQKRQMLICTQKSGCKYSEKPVIIGPQVFNKLN